MKGLSTRRQQDKYLATFTTCWARLNLYNILEKIDRNVLYYDTDSVIYLSNLKKNDVPLGAYLGDRTPGRETTFPWSRALTHLSRCNRTRHRRPSWIGRPWPHGGRHLEMTPKGRLYYLCVSKYYSKCKQTPEYLICIFNIVNEACIGGGGVGGKYSISLEVNRQISLINWQISP